MPRIVKKPTSEPSEMTPPPTKAASRPPTSAEGSARKVSSGEAPAPVGRLEEQEDADRGGHGEQEQPVEGRLPLGVLAEELGVIAQRERDRLEPLLDVPDHRPEVTPADVAAHVDPAGGPVALDDVRGRLDLDVGDVGQADAAAARRVDQQVADAGQALARGRRAPDLHVVGLAGPEHVSRPPRPRPGSPRLDERRRA